MNRKCTNCLKKNWVIIAMFFVLTPRLRAADMAVDQSTRPPSGIRTDFGDVLVENLGISRSYNLRELAGTPMKVTNTSSRTVNLRMDVLIPSTDSIKRNKIEEGFEPIPSIDWVTLSQSQFVVPSGESAYTDVLLHIPDDTKLYGRKFQADIYSRTIDKTFVNVGVLSHLMITIAKSPEVQKQIEQYRKTGVAESLDYTLIPDKLIIKGAPIGKTFDIKSSGRTIKLANSGEKPVRLRVRSVQVGNTPLSLQMGFEEPKDPRWLKPSKDVFEVDPASFVDPGLTLSLPNDNSLLKKKLMFVIQVEPADPDVIGVTYYGKIYVDVEEK